MLEDLNYQNPYFFEVTAYVLLVFACESVQHNTFKFDNTLLMSGPFARFFWLDVEKVLKDKHYIELRNSSESDSEYIITSIGRSFANIYSVQNNIDLDMEPQDIIISIYNK